MTEHLLFFLKSPVLNLQTCPPFSKVSYLIYEESQQLPLLSHFAHLCCFSGFSQSLTSLVISDACRSSPALSVSNT